MTNPLSALPPVILGPLWMVSAGVGYTLASACTRALSDDYSTIQLAFLRCLIAVPFFVPMLIRNGIGVMKTTVFPMHLLRAVLTYGAMLTWFFAVSVIPVSDYTALLYAQPIFTILFAMYFLGQKAGPRTWVAVAAAFVGAMIILRPGFQVINLGMIAALSTGILFAAINTTVKIMSRTDSSTRSSRRCSSGRTRCGMTFPRSSVSASSPCSASTPSRRRSRRRMRASSSRSTSRA